MIAFLGLVPRIHGSACSDLSSEPRSEQRPAWALATGAREAGFGGWGSLAPALAPSGPSGCLPIQEEDLPCAVAPQHATLI